MLNKEWKWHYFMLHGIEYLVLGYNHQKHNVLCVSLQHLHEKDKEDLMWIVDGDAAQRTAYLVSVLVNHPYTGGGNWWERLQPHVFFAEMGQIRNRIPTEQYEAFMTDFHKHNSPEKEPGQRWWEVVPVVNKEVVEQTSAPEPVKTENIDSILFGPVLSDEDRKDITDLARLAGLKTRG